LSPFSLSPIAPHPIRKLRTILIFHARKLHVYWICVNFETNTKEKPQLVFYHIDSKYPLGISPPVFAPGGDTKNGCFVNHSKLGMVYLDFGTGYNLTMIYKMNDLLPIIAEKLKALVK